MKYDLLLIPVLLCVAKALQAFWRRPEEDARVDGDQEVLKRSRLGSIFSQ
jgi:hypothetical protein